MRPRAATLLLLLALLAPTAAEAEASPLSWDPDPVPPDTPVTVRVAAGEGARNVTLKVCISEEQTAVFCFPLQTMTPATDPGVFEATTDARWGFPAEEEVGLNVTWIDANGRPHHIPEGEPDEARAYVFFTTSAAVREAPAPWVALVLVAIGLAATRFRFHQ